MILEIYLRETADMKTEKTSELEPTISGYKAHTNEKIASFLCGMFLILVILITSAQAVCYWIPGWWRNEYAKYNTPQYVTGEMSLDDAVYITEQMLEYCIGRLDTLDDTEATIDGITAPFFTDREKLHLEDCRNIFLSAVKLRVVSLLMIVGLLIAVWYSLKKHADSQQIKRLYARTLAGGYLAAIAVFLIFTIIVVFMGVTNFDLLFTRFHHVFFDNDLWILDPRVDNLVNIMQEQVFADAAIWIASIWAVICAILAIISGVIFRRFSSPAPQEAA